MFKKNIALLSLVGLLSACQSTSNVEDLQSMACFYPDAPKEEAPKWVCGITPQGLEISATGFAKKNVAGTSIMSDISVNDARVNLARQFEVNVQSIIKTATTSNTDSSNEAINENVNEYFEKVTKSISSTVLNNSRIITKRTSPAGGLYTLVGMDKTTFDMNFEKVIKKAEAKDAELWNKFNDKKTSEALEKIVAKLSK
ncbi:LPP20 family lipoprotein [Psychromonas sp. MME2]|uniref:LPP20 family lipoprotein n=1 Tax=unclassified Psychromonas TaxID=2614957 RepID=UPI00339BEFB3